MAVPHTETHDLAHRTNGRYEITLLLDGTSGKLTISVLDEVTGISVELPVHADEALEVFHHPFAYPGFRGVPFYGEDS